MTTTQTSVDPTTISYSKLVMPVDFSPLSWQLLPLANFLAESFHRALRIVHVDTSSPWTGPSATPLVLEALPLKRHVSVDVVGAHDVVEGIVETLADESAPLLIMATHGHTGSVEIMMGSTCENVLRQWHGPVVAGGPAFDGATFDSLSRIVACADASGLSADVVDDIRRWAVQLSLPVELATVVSPSMSVPLRIVRELEHRLETAADQLRIDGCEASVVMLESRRVGREIVEYADVVPGTLVVMATHVRRAPARALIGSVATNVVRHSRSAVLLRHS